MTELRAGPVTARLAGADVRAVRAGGVELAQRIYVALRDEAWNTIPAAIERVEVEQREDGFLVELEARHRHEAIDFSWHGRIEGSADGTIAYELDGVANTAFRYAKLGFNVHHPLTYVGRRFRARTPGGELRGTLPREIVPQRVEQGRLTALFPEFDRLAVELDGVEARFEFEGDLFELQDHRNWTDGNLKSYGTPMSVPWPFEAQPGQRIRQRVAVSPGRAEPRRGAAAPDGPVRIELGEPLGRTLPPLGLAVASHGDPLSERELGLLRALAPAHLRVDLALDGGWERALARAAGEAEGLGARLEVALFVGADAEAELEAAGAALAPLDVARALVFPSGRGFASAGGSTPGALARLARERLPGLPIVGGTNQFFAELNRDPPQTEALDGVVFSVNPQVHACDDESLFENLPPQAEVVEAARELCGGLPVHVSPVTLVGRGGPFPAGPPDPDGLPGQVDVRQASQLGAAWTALSVRQLAAAGAASATYFETTGWLGVVERDAGPPRPDLFPSRPGDVFPLYRALGLLAELRDEELVASRSSDPLQVDALAFRGSALVVNATAAPRRVELGAQRLELEPYALLRVERP